MSLTSARYHVLGTAVDGPVGETRTISGMGQYEQLYGARTASSAVLYDDLDLYFAEGGQAAYVTRVPDLTGVSIRAALTASGEQTRGAAVAVPGLAVDEIGATLLAHAALYHKLALLSGGKDTMPEELADQAYLLRRPEYGDHGLVLWPWVTNRHGRHQAPTGYAAAVRARIHIGTGYWGNPTGPYSAARTIRSLRFPNTPENNEALAELLLSAIVVDRDNVQVHGWWSLSPDRTNFPSARVRDLTNNLAVELSTGYARITAPPVADREKALSQVVAHTRSVLSTVAKHAGFVPLYNDAGWKIDDGYHYAITVPDAQPQDRNIIDVKVSVRPLRTTMLIGVRIFRIPFLEEIR